MTLRIPIISEFDGKGVKKAVAEFKQLEGAGKKAQFALKKAALPAAAALGGLAVAAMDAAKAALEDQKAQAVLANTLRQSTKATDAQIAATEQFITEQGRLFGVTDDQLRPAFGKLARATQDLGRAQRLTTIAQDIAATTGKDLSTVTQALVRAEQGQFTALKRLGVPMGKNTMAQMEMAKATRALTVAEQKYQVALRSGDKKAAARALENLAKAQATLNAVTVEGADFALDLEKAFAGGAAVAADTTAGKMQRLTVALNEAKESIGAAFLPVLERLLPFLQRFADWAQKNPGLLAAAVAGFAALTAAVIALNIAMSLNPVSLIVIGIAALIAGLVAAYHRFEAFKNIVDTVFTAMRWWFNNVTIPLFTALLNAARAAFNGIAQIWNATVGKLKFTVPNWVPGIGGKGFSVPNLPILGDDSSGGRGSAIPMMAAGGIVTSPTLAMIGEAGPEAVIPLNRMGSMGGGGVVINVNGGDPQALVETLRRYFRQNGPLPFGVAQ